MNIMIEAAIARRYAKALLELAKDEGKLDLFLEQMEELKKLFSENAEVAYTLTNRFVDLNARYCAVEEIGAKMELHTDVIHFLKLLMKKSRLVLLTEIASAFKYFVYAAQNKVEAVITSAKPLPENLYQEIQKEMSRKTHKEVLLDKVSDESVLGGIKVRIGNDVYDGTVKADLERMKQQMMKTVF